MDVEAPAMGAEEATAGRGGGSGIGLENTRARLEELYGPASFFEFGDGEAGGAVVRLAIPFRRAARKQEPAAARRGA